MLYKDQFISEIIEAENCQTQDPTPVQLVLLLGQSGSGNSIPNILMSLGTTENEEMHHNTHTTRRNTSITSCVNSACSQMLFYQLIGPFSNLLITRAHPIFSQFTICTALTSL